MNLVQSIMDGLLIGGVYATIAVGLSLAYGVMRIVNFCHGDILMVTMYISFFIFSWTGMNPYLIVIFTMLIMFVIGCLFQQGIISSLLAREKDREPVSVLLFTAALGIFITNMVLVVVGPSPKTANTQFTGKIFEAAGLFISIPKLISFVIAIGVTIALYFFLQKSETGRAIRATSQNREVAALMGINQKNMYTLAFGISLALVGISGALLLPYFSVTTSIGTVFGFKAFVIVVLGGMGSVIGALLGGLMIGVIEKVGTLLVSDTASTIAVFAVFVVILLFRPYGLLGKKDL
jgi:branched-chain amino acid transport system permease protein